MADSKINYRQIGSAGLQRFGGYVYEEFMPQLRWPRAGDVYKEMSDNDPVVGAILYMAEMLIRKAEWTVKPASDSPEDKEAAEFLLSCINDMDMSWNDTISEIISMLPYGFSFHEIVYKIRRGPNEKEGKYRSKHSDGRVAWRRIPIRAQSTLHEWEFDDDGDVKAFTQMAPPHYNVVTIPLEKGLLFRTKVARDNPEGKSMLRNAYRPWYFKKHIEEIEGIGIERDLAGLPVLTAPENMDLWNEDDARMVALKENAEALVRSIRRDSEEGILLPNGWDLKLLSTGSSRQFDTNAIINRYDNRIAITMLSDIVLIGGDKAGSFALADTKTSLLAGALEAHVGNIADVFNKYAVPKLFSYNSFPNITGLPVLVPGEIETPSLKEIALLLRAMGLDISKDMELQNYLRQIASMPRINKEQHEDLYANQGDTNNTPTKVKETGQTTATGKEPDDTVDNDFEQNDMAYTGQ